MSCSPKSLFWSAFIIFPEDALHLGDDSVAFPAPVRREQQFLWTFAAEAFHGDFEIEDADHFRYRRAVFLKTQKLNLSAGEFFRHPRSAHDVQRVELRRLHPEPLDFAGGAYKVIHAFPGEPDDQVRRHGEPRALEALHRAFEIREGVLPE